MNQLRVRDLGPLEPPVLVFGGAYSNAEALDALMAAAARRGISADRIVFTGDAIAYASDPQTVVDALRTAGIAAIAGNVEQQIAAEQDDCACGYRPGSTCDLLSRQWYEYAFAQVDDAARAWMRALPDWLRFTIDGRRFVAVHGLPSRINGYAFASTPAATLDAEIGRTEADAVVCGHSGIPFTRAIGAKLWLNAGVVGMPANDGTPRTWFATIEREREALTIRFASLNYDHAAAAQKMRARGLPAVYASAIETGLWPDLDILPAAEREAAGRALALDPLRWSASLEFAR